MTKNEKRIARERVENRRRANAEATRAFFRERKREERASLVLVRRNRPAAYDREKYGPAVEIKPMGSGAQRSRTPNPQAYPSGCRRLFRNSGITPAEARKGKVPEAVR